MPEGRNLTNIVPPTGAASVTPDDDTDLATPALALNVAAAGAVKVTTVGGDTVTLYIAAGIAFPCQVARVHNTDTTATGIVALY